MDFIDFLVDSSDEYLTGTFYKQRPKSKADGGINFTYTQLDPNSKVFGKILGEIRADRASYAIKTNDQCGFNIAGYIVTQNGLIWQITEVVTNEQTKSPNDVLRWFKTAQNAECSMRMIQVDDLYDINSAYDDICNISIKGYNKRIKEVWYTVNDSQGAEFIEDILNIQGFSVAEFSVRKGSKIHIFLSGTSGKIESFSEKYDLTSKNTAKSNICINIDTKEIIYENGV